MSGYLEFYRTGNEKFDEVLSRIETAGDMFHHTSEWIEESEILDGKSYLEYINEAIQAVTP